MDEEDAAQYARARRRRADVFISRLAAETLRFPLYTQVINKCKSLFYY